MVLLGKLLQGRKYLGQLLNEGLCQPLDAAVPRPVTKLGRHMHQACRLYPSQTGRSQTLPRLNDKF